MNRYRLICKKIAHLSLLLALNGVLLFSVQAQSWLSLGPGPLFNGQSEGIPDTPVIGAIHGFATHPTDSNIIYVASVNGGIWKTNNANAASPTWLPLSDAMPSLTMSDIEFDPSDNTAQTLVASFGRYSSLGSTGGSRSGVLRTTDGGANWTQIDGGMVGRNISSIEARGTTLLAAVDFAESFTCNNIGIFRSTNTGSSWTQLSTGQGLIAGGASALSSDPSNSQTFYVGIHNFNNVCSANPSGIYKTTNTGTSWTKVSDAAMDAIISTNNCHFEISVGVSNNVFVSMVCGGGTLDGVFRSGNGGTSWTVMDLPGTFEDDDSDPNTPVVFVGIHPGGQGNKHSSLVADPTDVNIVYIGGDRQASPFPSSINALNFSGRLFRGDASLMANSQWSPLTHSGTASNSSPHADSRELRFDAAGSLLESDDGGIYRRSSPRSTTGNWLSVNGDMKVNEQHDTAFDTLSSITMSGNQDNGTSIQDIFAGTTWRNFQGGDGGDVVVDNLSLSGVNQSVRFMSFQRLSAARRLTFAQNGNFMNVSSLGLIVTSGAAFESQFVTPLAINNLNGNRMIIGGGNSVYESSDQGDTLTEIGMGISVVGSGRNNIAYGATGNEDILYVGACQGSCFEDNNDGVFVRTTAAGALIHVLSPTESVIQGITVDPSNPSEAYVIENNKVFRTTNTGANWSEITGNLTNFGRLRSVAFLTDPTDSGLAVGSDRGVFVSRQSSGFSSWLVAGAGMPNTPVYDLTYDITNSRLIAGTMGRGAFVISGILNQGNSAPVVGNDQINVGIGGTTTVLSGGSLNLLDNDSDPDNGDTLSLQIMPVSIPFNGDVTLSANGTFSYTHDGSMTNTDQFFYRVCDNGTPMLCTDGQVDISIGSNKTICSNPNVTITDNNATGINDTLIIVAQGTLADLNVSLEINHTYVGDLIVSLKHDSSNTEILLLNNPGSGSCNASDISVTLDDSAAAPGDDQCEATSPAIGNTFRPTAPLSGFNNLELAGNWSLKVVDTANGDEGTLISWCLDPTVVSSNDTIFSNGFE